ncbi:SET domain-containing protein, partial [Cladophialophora immunda]
MSRKTGVLTRSVISLLCLSGLVTGAHGEGDVRYRASFDQEYQPGVVDIGLATNESMLPDAFSPWSYKPACTAKLSLIGSELCVYTDRYFSNGRGISIFTTPEIAGEFAAVLASLQDPPLLDTLGINGFSGAWYTHPVPGKGIGMLAKHDLRRGDTITAYTPVLLAYKEAILPKDQRETFLQLAIAQLPAPSREAYLKLATISDDPGILAQDIAGANSFEMRLGKGKADAPSSEAAAAHLAIIPEASRMNHDCAPNAIFHTNASTLAHVVRATRPIRKDEEITIAYTNPLEPRAVRQKYLSDAFHFTCACSRCLRGGRDTGATADADADADTVLSEIAALQDALARGWSDPASAAGVTHAERLVRLLRAEGLDGYLDPAYCYAAL